MKTDATMEDEALVADGPFRGWAVPKGLPERIKAGAFDYRVEEWKQTFARSAQRYGETDHQNFVIRVDTSLGAKQTAETLMHEVLHVVYRQWGLEDEDKEERIVSVMSFGLAAVLRDNPGLGAWFDGMLR